MAEGVQLYLIRHGLAAQRGEAFPDDTKRPLTSRGIARLKVEARALAAMEVAFDQIVSSPLVRARQTAEVFAEGMPTRAPIANCEALAPGGKPASVIDELSKYTRRSRIALVGHEPEMGELAARLIGSRMPLEFKKGAICRIDFEALPPTRPGHLRWFLTPWMLRKVGK